MKRILLAIGSSEGGKGKGFFLQSEIMAENTIQYYESIVKTNTC